MSMPPSRPGRARDPAADRAILEATLRLVAEEGYERLTMEGVAERAGVGKTTVYRRWASKRALALAAVDHIAELVTGGVERARAPRPEGGLERIAAATATFYRGPWGRALLGLVVETWRSPGLSRAVRARFLEPRREALRRALRADVERGALRGGADLELAIDMVVGAVLYRALLGGARLDSAGAARLAAILRGGLAGGAAAPRRSRAAARKPRASRVRRRR
jgi:AcrR family transcriptional regulator